MVSLRLKQIVETNTGCSVHTLGFSGRISNTNKQAVTCCKKANWVKVSTQAELGSIDLKHTKICTTNERKLCQTNQICKTFPMLVQNDHNCTALHPVKWPSLTLHNKTFCFGHLTQQRIIYSRKEGTVGEEEKCVTKCEEMEGLEFQSALTARGYLTGSDCWAATHPPLPITKTTGTNSDFTLFFVPQTHNILLHGRQSRLNFNSAHPRQFVTQKHINSTDPASLTDWDYCAMETSYTTEVSL